MILTPACVYLHTHAKGTWFHKPLEAAPLML